MRWFVRGVAALAALVLAVLGYGYAEATRIPAIARYTVRSPGWRGPPITIALISDTHAVLPDMPPARLARIAAQASALHPDLIVLTGDYIGRLQSRTGTVAPADATRVFAALHAPLGVYAVLGNHDMGDGVRPLPALADAVTAGLRAAGIVVLRNEAVRAGRFWIAGTEDTDWGHAAMAGALGRVPPGAPLLILFHNPDVFATVPPGRVALAVAGHTHGGQVAPFGWRPVLPVIHRNWARGLVWDRGMPMVVTSGVGASFVPVRIGVPPEIALITLEEATR